MCTYIAERADVQGSGKGATGWFPLTTVTAAYDHPVHAQAEHTVNIDFTNPGRGPAARVGMELTTDSAIAVVESIARVLATAPTDLTGVDREAARELVAAAERVGQRLPVSS